MRTANLALMLLLASACGFAFAQLTRPVDRTVDRNQILNSIFEISKAYVARDPAPFERLFLENYASIRRKPIYNQREQLIAMMQADSVKLRAKKKLDYETLSYESGDPQINFYGRAAVVNITKTHFWRYGGKKCESRIQGTEVWIKPEDDWKIAASHTTTFHCESRPVHPPHPAVAAIDNRTRAPLNSDRDAEQQIRDLIKTLVAARASLDERFEAVLARHVADSFVSTNLNGEVGRDRSILSTIQVPLPSRAAALRNQEDAVQVYGDAAIYTYRIRPAAEAATAENPQQTTIVFARAGGTWLIVAAHTSRNAVD